MIYTMLKLDSLRPCYFPFAAAVVAVPQRRHQLVPPPMRSIGYRNPCASIQIPLRLRHQTAIDISSQSHPNRRHSRCVCSHVERNSTASPMVKDERQTAQLGLLIDGLIACNSIKLNSIFVRIQIREK